MKAFGCTGGALHVDVLALAAAHPVRERVQQRGAAGAAPANDDRDAGGAGVEGGSDAVDLGPDVPRLVVHGQHHGDVELGPRQGLMVPRGVGVRAVRTPTYEFDVSAGWSFGSDADQAFPAACTAKAVAIVALSFVRSSRGRSALIASISLIIKSYTSGSGSRLAAVFDSDIKFLLNVTSPQN